jgi:hypothetical protein
LAKGDCDGGFSGDTGALNVYWGLEEIPPLTLKSTGELDGPGAFK